VGRRSAKKTYRFGLESLDGLHMGADVVRDGFKFTQELLRFIYNPFIP
jgi:hypothetical protein